MRCHLAHFGPSIGVTWTMTEISTYSALPGLSTGGQLSCSTLTGHLLLLRLASAYRRTVSASPVGLILTVMEISISSPPHAVGVTWLPLCTLMTLSSPIIRR